MLTSRFGSSVAVLGLAGLACSQSMRVPVGNIDHPIGSVKLLRNGSAVPCHQGDQAFAHDLLCLGPKAKVAVRQVNGVVQTFTNPGGSPIRKDLLRTESSDEKSMETTLANYAKAMTRPRGSRVIDESPIPAALFALPVRNPVTVTLETAGAVSPKFELNSRNEMGYTNPSASDWLRRAENSGQELDFTLVRNLEYGQARDHFKLMSSSEEKIFLAELNQAHLPDPVDNALSRAVILFKHGLPVLATAQLDWLNRTARDWKN